MLRKLQNPVIIFLMVIETQIFVQTSMPNFEAKMVAEAIGEAIKGTELLTVDQPVKQIILSYPNEANIARISISTTTKSVIRITSAQNRRQKTRYHW